MAESAAVATWESNGCKYVVIARINHGEVHGRRSERTRCLEAAETSANNHGTGQSSFGLSLLWLLAPPTVEQLIAHRVDLWMLPTHRLSMMPLFSNI